MVFNNKEVMVGLMDEALALEKLQQGHLCDSDWCESHEHIWRTFEQKCEDYYNKDIISAEQFDELMVVAFWHYEELKCDSDEWCEWYDETHKGYVWNHDNFYKMVD